MRNKFILFVILIFSVTCLNAQKIVDVTLTANSNKLYISARIDKDIPNEIFQLLRDGFEVTLMYTIKIFKERPLWDSNIKTVNFKKVVRFKLRENQYYLYENNRKFKVRNRKELNKKLKRINRVYLIDKKALDKKVLNKGSYYLKIRASLESVKMLPPIVWIFNILDLGELETPWVKKKIK